SCTSSCSATPGDRQPRHSPRNPDQQIAPPITASEWAECLPQDVGCDPEQATAHRVVVVACPGPVIRHE
ncbi:MAG: hypothetical protein M3Y33_12410, partial [Actinomycetota bacterium]|nr:hypothetical protein [Actinomycetota bacterium]